jgi:hypothetical protein
MRFIVTAGTWGLLSMLASVALLAISIVEHVREKNVTSYVLLFFAALAFGVGAFIAWHEENKKYEAERTKHDNPNFQLTIASILTMYDPNRNITTACFAAMLVNSGSPSVAIGWTARYQSPSIDMTLGFMNPSSDELLWEPLQGQKLRLRRMDMLPARTLIPIERGHSRHGRVLFEFSGDRRAEVYSGAAQIWVGCSDVTGRLCQQLFTTSPGYIQPELRVFPDETIVPEVNLMLPQP